MNVDSRFLKMIDQAKSRGDQLVDITFVTESVRADMDRRSTFEIPGDVMVVGDMGAINALLDIYPHVVLFNGSRIRTVSFPVRDVIRALAHRRATATVRTLSAHAV